MKSYRVQHLRTGGPVRGFLIHTPSEKKLYDTHPLTISAELNRLNNRIKQLEEAGDGLLNAMRDDWSEYVDWIDETTDAIGKWRKAKEAKP